MITTNLDKERKPRSGSFVIPSASLLYQDGCPKKADIVPFGFDTEDILMQPGKGLEKLASVAKNTVRNFPENFDFRDLLTGDLYAMIACARSLTYGENYKFKAECPECEAIEIITIKVPDEVPIQTWDAFPTREELEASFSVKLTQAKDVIKYKFLTIKEELELSEFKRKSKATGGVSSSRVHSIAAQIVSVNGGVPDNLTEASDYVRKLRGQDMIELTEAIEASDCGIDMSWKIGCDKCHHAYEYTIPLSEDFFRRNRY